MKKEKYMDSSLPAEERARDLLQKMNRKEKVGQVNQRLYGFHAYEKRNGELSVSRAFEEEVEAFQGLGVLYGLYRSDPWSGRDFENGLYGEDAVKAYNMLQRYVLEHSRLGIPMLLSTECPHGHQALDGYLLPVNLAMGATFHPKLVEKAYHVCGKQMRELGVDMALISMLDVLRDPRWGRSEECFGEDPLLCAVMAEAVVRAVEEEQVGTVAKHFAAQGETTGGVNASAARIGERELREIHLPPMKRCADAGAEGVMAAYNEIDGVPCHANPFLLKTILRDEMGFDGIVMADGFAVDRLTMLTDDEMRAGVLALSSGVDVSLWDNGFSRLEEALDKGLVSEEVLDDAVLRVLTMKFQRGLFEKPFLQEEKERTYQFYDCRENLELARESMVLLKNCDKMLPLSLEKEQKIAVIGPNAMDLYSQLGDYTPPQREGCADNLFEGISHLVKEKKKEQITVTGYPGCQSGGRNPQLLEEAVKGAKVSDVTILVLGGSSSRFGEVTFDKNGAAIVGSASKMDCGEGVDLAGLEIPEEQRELADAVYAAAKKTVTVIVAGRPYCIGAFAEKSNALLYAFYPGPRGGEALADLLFGMEEPSGRLPVSLPRHSGQLPVYYNHRSSYEGISYCDMEKGALYSFGEGFGYGCIEYADFQLESRELFIASGHSPQLTLSFRVDNRSEAPAYAVPMVFLRHKQGTIIPRIAELKWFEKFRLKPNECRQVQVQLGVEELSVWNREMEQKAEAGGLHLMLKDGARMLYEADVAITEK